MKIERITILVTAKTYPTISSRYNETVCILLKLEELHSQSSSFCLEYVVIKY